MEYKEKEGDLFKVDRTKYVLAHCISSDVTATRNMNAGIAKKFRDEFPKMAAKIEPKVKLGRAIRYKRGKEIVYNLISKKNVREKVYDDPDRYYLNLRSSLRDMMFQMQLNGEKFLAMPTISSGLDGGDWNVIREIIQDIFKDSEINILIRKL